MVFVVVTLSAQKLMDENTVDNTSQSVVLKQSCRAEVASFVQTLTVFIVGLCLQISGL